MKRRRFLQTIAGSLTLAMPGESLAALRQAVPSLADLAGRQGIIFGSAVSRAALSDPAYAELVKHHCAMLVGENAFKWQYLEPRPSDIEQGEANWIVGFGRRADLPLRGHCFLWNHAERMPPWLVDRARSLDRQEYRRLTRHMWRHGARLARLFPQIECWDAINEAVDPATGQMRETPFTRILGTRYFDIAFRILHEKHPDAQLAYNDTMAWEADGTHRDGVLRLLEGALERRVPIHALGIQSHIGKTLGEPRDERAWRDFLREVQGMGLDVHLTEFDCSDRKVAKSGRVIRDLETAAHVKGYLDLTLDFRNVRQLLVWSLGDGPSYMNRQSYPDWRRRDDGHALRGHPFDEALRPKPLYFAMANALRHAPRRSS